MAIVTLVTIGSTRTARADVQAWTGLEARAPITDGKWGLPTHARWVTETRFGGPRDGLSFLLARIGPMWELGPNVLLNLNGVQALATNDDGVTRPESRIEVEPNVRGRLFGVLAANFRQRAELRWIAGESSYRYRAQLRVTYHPADAFLAPFISTEVFVATRARLLESRNVFGLSLFASKNMRFDLGYMLRPRQPSTMDGSWALSHIAIITLTFAPQLAPIVESGGG